MRYDRSNEEAGFVDGLIDGAMSALAITLALGIAVIVATFPIFGYRTLGFLADLLPVLFVIFVAVLIISPVKRVERDNQ